MDGYTCIPNHFVVQQIHYYNLVNRLYFLKTLFLKRQKFFSSFFFLFFGGRGGRGGLPPWHVEIPRPGTGPTPQKWPEPQWWQCQILNLLSYQRTWNCGSVFFNPGAQMVAISPHKKYKLGSLSFPTFKQIENLSWAGESKVGSNLLCSAYIGCDGSHE